MNLGQVTRTATEVAPTSPHQWEDIELRQVALAPSTRGLSVETTRLPAWLFGRLSHIAGDPNMTWDSLFKSDLLHDPFTWIPPRMQRKNFLSKIPKASSSSKVNGQVSDA
ncbi:hypothetical protein TNCV_4573161 [Trichonephila clavipes]|nr:hypothetical protein TNCV_4573161 [Trichonephila clavipes]